MPCHHITPGGHFMPAHPLLSFLCLGYFYRWLFRASSVSHYAYVEGLAEQGPDFSWDLKVLPENKISVIWPAQNQFQKLDKVLSPVLWTVGVSNADHWQWNPGGGWSLDLAEDQEFGKGVLLFFLTHQNNCGIWHFTTSSACILY